MRALIAITTALLFASSTFAETTIKFANDWKWEGPAAPLLMALDNGWYKDAGLDVSMDIEVLYSVLGRVFFRLRLFFLRLWVILILL